jgi:hypothetical protein
MSNKAAQRSVDGEKRSAHYRAKNADPPIALGVPLKSSSLMSTRAAHLLLQGYVDGSIQP